MNSLDSLLLSDANKAKLLSQIPRAAHKMPYELMRGDADNMVYMGRPTSTSPGYVGVTNNFDLGLAQHQRAGRAFQPDVIPGAQNLTRGQARAVEELCIVKGGLSREGGLENRIHSIRPGKPYYAQALIAAEALLTSSGGSCPVTR